MNDYELIANLARDLKPVRRLPGAGGMTTYLVCVMLLPAIAVTPLLGMRHDLTHRILQPWALLVTLLLVLACTSAAYSMGQLARPARRAKLGGAGAALVLWLAVLALVLWRTPWFDTEPWLKWLGEGLYCTARTILVSLAPILFGVWLVRRGATTRPATAGAILGFAAASLGALVLHWTCDLDEPSHVLFWHYMVPAAILSYATSRLCRMRLRW